MQPRPRELIRNWQSCYDRSAHALALPCSLALFACLFAGCGSEFELPPQPPPLELPEPGYNLQTIWHVPSPGDILIQGSYVLVIEENQRLSSYYAQRNTPDPTDIISEFTGLIQPTHLTLGRNRDSTFVVVADAGDMHCKIYHWQGGAPLHSFTDSLWGTIGGLAADDELNIYVGDSHRSVVNAYDRWGNFRHTVTSYGTGSGYVVYPHGLHYMETAGKKRTLLIADTGKHWVQRLDPAEINTPTVLMPIGMTEDELSTPMDVAAGTDGEYIYIASSGHDQVLRYRFEGTLQDTVYSPLTMTNVVPPIHAPCFICTQGPLVFVSDPEENRVVIVKYMSE